MLSTKIELKNYVIKIKSFGLSTEIFNSEEEIQSWLSSSVLFSFALNGFKYDSILDISDNIL